MRSEKESDERGDKREMRIKDGNWESKGRTSRKGETRERKVRRKRKTKETRQKEGKRICEK